MEEALARQPAISVPSISLCGADDGVGPPPMIDEDAEHFSGFYERRVLAGVGHNIPEETPQETLKAILDLLQR
jgi:pimeloyl-ACP methyl ester carboxylesterase